MSSKLKLQLLVKITKSDLTNIINNALLKYSKENKKACYSDKIFLQNDRKGLLFPENMQNS
jgi:hypothetical protein